MNVTNLCCECLLFDLDGVLVDSTPAVERHWMSWCTKHQLSFDSVITIAHGRRTIETIKLVAPHLDPEKEALLYEQYECEDFSGIQAINGAIDFTGTLNKERWAIVTSCGLKLALARLNHAGINIPEIIVSANDVVNGKPDPEGYLKAANMLGFSPSDCIVFEDAPNGLNAAIHAGMRCVALTTTHSLDSLTNADAIIPDFRHSSVSFVNNKFELGLRTHRSANL